MTPFPLKQLNFWFSGYSSFKLAKIGNFMTMEVAMFLAQKLICMNSVMSQGPLETVRKIKTVLYYVSVNSKHYHPPGQILGKGSNLSPLGQIFWSNALPLDNFQRSNPQGPGRFSIFLLLMNNYLSLRFRMKMFSSCNGKEAYSKKTHTYTKPNRLFIKYILVATV